MSGSDPGERPPGLQPGERLPWLLRPSRRDLEPQQPADRETDRTAALAARRVALRVIPAVGAVWLVVAVLAGEDALRVVTVAALVICVAVGMRATSTIQRFRRRWVDPEAIAAPPRWITLGTVAAAVAVVVAGTNVAADIQSDRSAVLPIVLTVVALTLVGAGAYAHIAGGRSVAAALRRPTTRP